MRWAAPPSRLEPRAALFPLFKTLEVRPSDGISPPPGAERFEMVEGALAPVNGRQRPATANNFPRFGRLRARPHLLARGGRCAGLGRKGILGRAHKAPPHGSLRSRTQLD